jgi:hypothetical protein
VPKYFGYILPKKGETHDIVIAPRQASVDVLAEFERLTNVIRDLQPLAIALAASERDYVELIELPERQTLRLNEIGSPDIPMRVVADLLVETTRALSAFLASTSALLGQATKYMSRVHGEEDAVTTAWHTRRRELHAGSSAYRIMYELRNYSQHHALPISGIGVRGERNEADRMVFGTGAHIDRDGLLASGYDWRGRAVDIAALDAEFDALPLAMGYFRCIQDLMAHLATHRAPELVECRDYLAAVRRILKAPSNARIWLFDYTGPKHMPPSNGAVVPEEQFLWMLRVLYSVRLRELGADRGDGTNP